MNTCTRYNLIILGIYIFIAFGVYFVLCVIRNSEWDVAKKCIYEPADEKKCEACPYSKFSTATDDCWFHLMGDMIFLLDGGTPTVVHDGEDYYIWDYEEKTWKEVTKEEYEKLKNEEHGRHEKKEEKDD